MSITAHIVSVSRNAHGSKNFFEGEEITAHRFRRISKIRKSTNPSENIQISAIMTSPELLSSGDMIDIDSEIYRVHSVDESIIHNHYYELSLAEYGSTVDYDD